MKKGKQYGKVDLPSTSAAMSLMRGDSGAVLSVASTYLQRAALIGVGLKLFGVERHDARGLIRNSLVASATIQAFVLFEAWRQAQK